MSISSCLCCILPFLWCYICAAFYRFVVVYISYHIYAAFYRFCDVMSMLRFTILVVYLVMSMLHAFYRFLCCVLPFLWCYVYNAFYRFLWCYVYCAFYRFCGVTGIPASIARREPELYFSCIRVSVDHGFFQRTLIYLSLY